MCNVTLIATSHRENGMCNSNEVLKLLQMIKPDVIFEEASEPTFTDIYEGRLPDTLETFAVKIYRQEKNVAQYPVDINGSQLIDKDLKKSILNMFEIFERDLSYRDFKFKLHILSSRLGFSYLNSNQCEMLFAQKYFLEQALAQSYEQGQLVELHQTWIRINDFRESNMIANIYKYVERNKFYNAIFFIGAEHRKPIIDKIKQIALGEQTKINWDFRYFHYESLL